MTDFKAASCEFHSHLNESHSFKPRNFFSKINKKWLFVPSKKKKFKFSPDTYGLSGCDLRTICSAFCISSALVALFVLLNLTLVSFSWSNVIVTSPSTKYKNPSRTHWCTTLIHNTKQHYHKTLARLCRHRRHVALPFSKRRWCVGQTMYTYIYICTWVRESVCVCGLCLHLVG